MNTRPAQTGDAALLARLNRAVQQMHADNRPDFFKPPDDLAPFVQFFDGILAQSQNHVLIAEEDGQSVGYLYGEVIDRPENPYSYAWRYFYIHQISVEPPYRRQGIGSRLLAAARRLARELAISHLALDTWSFNKEAQAFFAKEGFVVFNQRLESFLD
jgi:diamine N-acetyltransferase